MLTITGTVAVALILLVGPYRTVQWRWRRLAPPFLPMWVHSNLAVAALVLVVLHLVGAEGPALNLTWVATVLFFVAFSSGLYGLFLASTVSRRRSWTRFHRRLNWVLYLALLPHVVGEGLVIPLLVLVLGAWAFWRGRSEVNAYLLRLTWPFHRGRPRARAADPANDAAQGDAMAAGGMAAGEYPVRFDVEYPEAPNRWLILIRWLLAIPLWIIGYILQYVAFIAAFIAFFALVFTRRYPNWLFKVVEGWMRWNLNMLAYILFRDEYPPFSWDEREYAPVILQIERREEYNRWLPLVKWLLAIPHYIALAILIFIGYFAGLALVIAVVVIGRYPRGLFDYFVGVGRWGARVNAYVFLLVDEYPPFSLK